MKITVNPRIHLTLISMHMDGYRINGGLGFSINDPKSTLFILESESFEFYDLRPSSLSPKEIENLERLIMGIIKRYDLNKNISVEVIGGITTHGGMGSGTSIKLACIEALFTLNKVDISQSEIIKLSKRGGTSGVGINTYFAGGLIFDLGIPNNHVGHYPSSQMEPKKAPLLLERVELPNWKIGICIPSGIAHLTQQEELNFFQNTCPLQPHHSHSALYHALFGVYASVKENNFETFVKSIRHIQMTEWKRKERELHGNCLKRIEGKLYELGALCVGMSSLGPLLFFFANDSDYNRIINSSNMDDCYVFETSLNNSGRKLTA